MIKSSGKTERRLTEPSGNARQGAAAELNQAQRNEAA
jgi:hypothetical protein